ncbi:MAG: hypothetical protein IPM24_03815 [Bryobacterales bacterium]|nr:hypothetical protein [Bryobacterales bacterium]
MVLARLGAVLALFVLPCHAEGLIPALSPAQAAEAGKAVAALKADPRGPYLRIRWFCKDGTVHPPQGVPCRERGGGKQHAERGPLANKLAGWNLDFGVILASLDYDTLFDASRGHHLIKQLVLEKYLVEVDDGWIYRRARTYRGARQIEDEERAGRALLTRMLADPDWVSRHYFLALQAVATVPHGVADGTVRKIRSLAAAISDKDARFQSLRARIHSQPSRQDLGLVREFIRKNAPAADAQPLLDELVALLASDAVAKAMNARLPAMRTLAAGGTLAAPLEAFGSAPSLRTAADLGEAIRREMTASKDGRRNLALADFQALLLEWAFGANAAQPGSRRAHLDAYRDAYRLAFAEGLLSERQLRALDAEMQPLSGRLPAEQWYQAVRYLARAVEWSRATAVRDFGPVTALYGEFEPHARDLLDHLLRSSTGLRMASVLEPLLTDAGEAVGLRHRILGQTANQGVFALNPGVATGKLGFVESERELAAIDPRGIYVIPETASDLKPVAGILTLDSGNALSHTQLLAANLGIPNATVPSSLIPELKRYEGKTLSFAVTPRGLVILREHEAATPVRTRDTPRIPLDVSRVRLDVRSLRPLDAVSSADSGVFCGPKGANLGQLARYFPGKVAPGLVIPFGVYNQHIQRSMPSLEGPPAPLVEQIRAAYQEADRLRDSGAPPADLQRYIYPRLAHFRKQIQETPLLPEFERELTVRLERDFKNDGLFVRSDTNAEDLPEFTGAGLNLTVPNVVGTRNVIGAIRRVWASPFTERAYDWRSRILLGGENVYPSVVLMRTVPADKSGVIATTDLDGNVAGAITVNASEGVSAVVDGGVAESLLLLPDGGVRLLQQARAAYRKVARPAGGFVNLPPLGGDMLLQPGEIAQVREMVAEVMRKYPPEKGPGGEVLPWDIEFGFEAGQLRLFQIRPLVRFQQVQTLEALSKLEDARPRGPVDMSGPLGSAR